MKLNSILFCLVVLLTCVAAAKNPKAEDDEDDDVVINKVNERFRNGQGTWKARRYPKFFRKSRKEKQAFLGAVVPNIEQSQVVELPDARSHHVISRRSVLPLEFDVRSKWGACNATINDVRDQLQCGSCWAHCTASVISDRICLASGNTVNAKISTQDQISCMPRPSLAPDGYNLCGGWDTQKAFRMYVLSGIVTGGEHNQPSVGCMPYLGASSTCSQLCANAGHNLTYAQDKSYGTNPILIGYILNQFGGNSVNYTWSVGPETGYLNPISAPLKDVETIIKEEIYERGPVTAGFTVYNDFYNYDSGVYVKSANAYNDGDHAVKIIGWGVENNLPYWLAVNSWSTSWGDGGFFKILRGSNHVNIENYITSATPVIPGASTVSTSASTRPTTAAPSTVKISTTPATTTTAQPGYYNCDAAFCSTRSSGRYSIRPNCSNIFCGCKEFYTVTCSAGLLFSPTTKTCQAPSATFCPTLTTPATVSTTPYIGITCNAAFCADKVGDTNWETSPCSSTYCHCRQVTQWQCGTVGQYFNAAVQNCVYPSSTFCPETLPTTPTPIPTSTTTPITTITPIPTTTTKPTTATPTTTTTRTPSTAGVPITTTPTTTITTATPTITTNPTTSAPSTMKISTTPATTTTVQPGYYNCDAAFCSTRSYGQYSIRPYCTDILCGCKQYFTVTCGAGLLFNPTTKTCQAPSTTFCLTSATPATVSTTPYVGVSCNAAFCADKVGDTNWETSPCSSTYCKCRQASQWQCGTAGQYFNAVSQSCTYPTSTFCPEMLPTTPTPIPTSTTTPTTTITTTPTTTTKPTTTTATPTSTTTPTTTITTTPSTTPGTTPAMAPTTPPTTTMTTTPITTTKPKTTTATTTFTATPTTTSGTTPAMAPTTAPITTTKPTTATPTTTSTTTPTTTIITTPTTTSTTTTTTKPTTTPGTTPTTTQSTTRIPATSTSIMTQTTSPTTLTMSTTIVATPTTPTTPNTSVSSSTTRQTGFTSTTTPSTSPSSATPTTPTTTQPSLQGCDLVCSNHSIGRYDLQPYCSRSYCGCKEVYLTTCDVGWLFNSATRYCQAPNDTFCSTSTTPISVSTTPYVGINCDAAFCADKVGWTSWEINPCSSTYCRCRSAAQYSCRFAGTYFNYILQNCMYPTSTFCSELLPTTYTPIPTTTTTALNTTPTSTGIPTTSTPITTPNTTLFTTSIPTTSTSITTSPTTKPTTIPTTSPVTIPTIMSTSTLISTKLTTKTSTTPPTTTTRPTTKAPVVRPGGYDRCDLTYCAGKVAGKYQVYPCSKYYCTCNPAGTTAATKASQTACTTGFFDGSTKLCKVANSTFCKTKTVNVVTPASWAAVPASLAVLCNYNNCQDRLGVSLTYPLETAGPYWCQCVVNNTIVPATITATKRVCGAKLFYDYRPEFLICRNATLMQFAPATYVVRAS